MKNNKNIKPVGLKGNEVISRMKDLMNLSPITENKSTSFVELTKEGPDGKVYAVVRENHRYFIKTSDKVGGNLVNEDFSYIGGLQNKTEKSYTSYANAIKQLNLKFLSLKAAGGDSGQVNVFRNDNLVTENGRASGSWGFVPESEEDEIPANKEDYRDQPGYIGVSETEDEEELVEAELDAVGDEDDDVDNDGDVDDSDKYIKNKRMKISSVVEGIDKAITDVLKKKV